MKHNIQFAFGTIFILIYLYLIIRILINSKCDNHNVVKELFLTGFVISIISIVYSTLSSEVDISQIILFIPLGFFAYVCIEENFKDAMMICLFFAVIIELAQLLPSIKSFATLDIIFSMIGGFIGIFTSYNIVKKISA